MGNNSDEEVGTKRGVAKTVKTVCCISTCIILVVLVVIAVKYRFLIRKEADHIITGNNYPLLGDESIMS